MLIQYILTEREYNALVSKVDRIEGKAEEIITKTIKDGLEITNLRRLRVIDNEDLDVERRNHELSKDIIKRLKKEATFLETALDGFAKEKEYFIKHIKELEAEVLEHEEDNANAVCSSCGKSQQ